MHLRFWVWDELWWRDLPVRASVTESLQNDRHSAYLEGSNATMVWNYSHGKATPISVPFGNELTIESCWLGISEMLGRWTYHRLVKEIKLHSEKESSTISSAATSSNSRKYVAVWNSYAMCYADLPVLVPLWTIYWLAMTLLQLLSLVISLYMAWDIISIVMRWACCSSSLIEFAIGISSLSF